jgi:putative transposase
LPKDEGDRQIATVPSNILERQFVAERPSQKWIADFTYIWTAEGWLYVAAVIDLFSRRVVGWSMSAGMTAQLVADALLMAVWRRGEPNELSHHSKAARADSIDRRNTLAKEVAMKRYRRSDRCARAALRSPGRPSGARRENCRQFWIAIASGRSSRGCCGRRQGVAGGRSTLVPEGGRRAGRKTYRTRNEARADVFDYIERFYNATRRHSTSGYLTVEFERKVGLA